jgi:hypothetical protein
MAGDATANSPARHIVAVLEKNQLIEGQTDCMNSIIYVKKVPCFAKRKKMLMIRQLKTIPIGVKFIKTKFCKSIHAFLKETNC